MGFSFEVIGTQKARIKSGAPGDALSTFIDVVKQSLGQRMTSFVVDFSADPQSLTTVLDPLKKLQQLVRSRGSAIILEGLSHTNPIVSKELLPLGFVVAGEAALKGESRSSDAATQHQELIPPALQKTLDALDTDFSGNLQLPPAAQTTPSLDAVQARLAALLQREFDLKLEEKTLDKRLQLLKKGELGNQSHLDEYKKLMAEEESHILLRGTISSLKKELVAAKELAQNEEKAHKDFATRLEAETKKKLEVLKKELESLKANFNKLQDEQAKKAPKKAEPTKTEPAKAEPTTEAKPEKPERPETKTEPKTESKIEPTSEPKPDSKIEQKSDAVKDPKAGQKPEG